MNISISEVSKLNYSLEDAFQIINSIIISEREKYENIIQKMTEKIKELNIEIDQLKDENLKCKNTIFQLQNQFTLLSNSLLQPNEIPVNIFNDKINSNRNANYNFEKLIKNNINISNDFFPNKEIKNLKNNYNSVNLNNNIIPNYTKKEPHKLNIDYQLYKNYMNQRLFNKKLVKKLNSFNLQRDKKFSKSFNYQNNIPFKIIKKKNDNDNNIREIYSQSSNDLDIHNYFKLSNNFDINNKIERKSFGSYAKQNYTNKKQNENKDKFNIIKKRIKNMKKGLIINSNRNNISKESINIPKIKYNTFRINRGNGFYLDNSENKYILD
jgi:hypothetical protein